MANRYWCGECGFKTPWLENSEGISRQIEHYARKHPATAPGGQVETRRCGPGLWARLRRRGFGLFGLPVLALGVGLLRNGGKVLAGVAYSGDRLSQLALIPASLSGLGIGGMVAGADWDREASLMQLIGFAITLFLALILLVLCGRPATKAYLDET